jgi:hypothetical protein
MKSTVSKVGRLGVKEIKQSYRKTGIKHPNKAGMKSKYDNPMKGIKAEISRSNILYVALSILGDFRLKWYEYGTVERNTGRKKKSMRKPHPTGRIKATPFFMSTIERIEKEIVKMYEESFEWAINRIKNKTK